MATELTQVEIKISLDAEHVDEARDRFDLRSKKADEATIWFCEDVDRSRRLRLDTAHLIVRLRRKEKAADDSTVKLRGTELQPPPGWDKKDGDSEFKLEGDWSGPTQSVSASVVAKVDQGLIGKAAQPRPLDDGLFRPAQHRLLAAVLGPDAIALGSLQPLGPISARQWKKEHKDGFRHDVAAEEWTVDDLRFLELSIRVPFEDALDSQTEFTEWVAMPAMAGTKTKIVLNHFAERGG